MNEIREIKHLPAIWHGSGQVRQQLTSPIVWASLTTVADRPNKLILWHLDDSGLQIWSKMHDVAVRTEIGVLEFAPAEKPSQDQIKLSVPQSFDGSLTARKLIISESGTTAESGVILRATDGAEIIIVAAADPYCLAIKGLPSFPYKFEPEYPLQQYVEAEI
jgi:hypothetical protein